MAEDLFNIDGLAEQLGDMFGFDENETEQFALYIEAFKLFREREAKYHSLWKQYGAVDSYQHMRSKFSRTQFLLEGFTEDQDDPLDLINYTAFFLRNLRAGRIHNTTESGEIILEETWRVVDRWWTEDPISREYRVLALPGSENVVQFREGGEGEWKTYRDEPLRA